MVIISILYLNGKIILKLDFKFPMIIIGVTFLEPTLIMFLFINFIKKVIIYYI